MLLLHPPVAPWFARTATGCEVTLLSDQADLPQVWLRTLPDNEERLIPMAAIGRSGALNGWHAFVPWDSGNPITLYAFKVLTATGLRWLAADGPHAHVPPEALHFRVNPQDRPPAWVQEQVFYQIFPDRFSRGDTPAGPGSARRFSSSGRPAVAKEWHDPIDFDNASNSFWGGDLAGIEQRLPYLQDELGVTALYLNPIFSAGSNHRYDTEDYTEVDPALGGNAALASLCSAMRQRGMRLLLDAVVNHTGTRHPWFNQGGSTRRGWYAFDDAGRPVGWKGHASLPVLDFTSPGVRHAIYEAPDSVLRRWLQPPYAIDGWRLDVIHMLGEGGGARNNAHFVRQFRRAMRQENTEAYVLGEHFSEATRWLQGDQEDGAMAYHSFTQPVGAWLGGPGGGDVSAALGRLPTAAFERWLAGARAAIPWDNQLAQLNLLDSHDTERLLTALGGDETRFQLAITLLFTSPGVPCIYYGDEIGLQGGPDPDCRRPFDWRRERWNAAIFAHYRQLTALRRQRIEWRHGAVQTLAVGADHLVFARYTGDAATVVAINRGAAVHVEVPLRQLPLPSLAWREAGSAAAAPGAGLSFTLPATSAHIWLGDAAPEPTRAHSSEGPP